MAHDAVEALHVRRQGRCGRLAGSLTWSLPVGPLLASGRTFQRPGHEQAGKMQDQQEAHGQQQGGQAPAQPGKARQGRPAGLDGFGMHDAVDGGCPAHGQLQQEDGHEQVDDDVLMAAFRPVGALGRGR